MRVLRRFQSIRNMKLNLCGLLQVKYKEKYEKEKGRAMLDFETPTYVTAKEAQHMQSQVKTLLPFPLTVEPLYSLLCINLYL